MTLQNVTPASVDLRVYRLARRILSTKDNGAVGYCMTHGQDNPLGVVCINNKVYLVCSVCAFTHLPEAERPLPNEGEPEANPDEIENPYCEHLRCFNLSNNQRCLWCDMHVCTVHSTMDEDGTVTCDTCEEDLNRMAG